MAIATATAELRQPFGAHIHELRQRLLSVGVVFLVGAAIGYWLYDFILDLLLRPLQQPLYYLSPAGGFSFVIHICSFFGLLLSIPMASYQLIRFVGPVLPSHTKWWSLQFVTASTLLALLGVVFAYTLSLPAALHFLGEFSTEQVKSLISTDAYISFILVYLSGFALLFQLPLLMLLLHQCFALRPGPLLGHLKWVVLGSFSVAAIITPTPDPINQTIMALPVIVLYVLTVGLIWILNSFRYHYGGGDVIPANAHIVHIAYTKEGLRQGYLCSWKRSAHETKIFKTFIDETTHDRLRGTLD
jgi:sec-independent protein translocase protein TatC